MPAAAALRAYVRLLIAEAMGSSYTRISRGASGVIHHVALGRPDLEREVVPGTNHLGLSDDELNDELEDKEDETTLPHRP